MLGSKLFDIPSYFVEILVVLDCTYCGPLSNTQLSGSIYLQVVDAADVILEVLDARDPLGSRCQEMEDLILGSSTDKRLVLVLNKIG